MATTNADLFDDGILWMINRTIFHPRGFALGVDPVTHDMKLMGEGVVPWNYAPSMNDIEDDLFTKFEALLQRQRENNGQVSSDDIEP